METIPSILHLQTEVNNNFSPAYKLESYLGKGSNSYIYRGVNNKKQIYLIKFIPKKNDYDKQLLEVGFLKALSLFKNSQNYINTCHDFSLGQKYIIVVMNVFRGQDLIQFSKKIKNLGEMDYYDIVKQIIKHSLEALSYIHKRGVAHQNINLFNLVVSCPDTKNIKYLKLVDFGDSCGYYYDINSNKYLNQKCMYIVKRMNKLPPEYHKKEELVNNIHKILKNNKNNVELYMAKKDDLWVLGTILWTLVNRKGMGHNPFSEPFPESIQMNNDNFIKFYGTEKLKNIHKFIVDNILVPVQDRKSANDLLNKFLLLEKYGWEYGS
jgi:serine/threonine protein kinase